jgi:Short repeat of unknown function (DUF308)
LRGLFAVLFGLLAIFMPRMTLLALALLFGAYALLDPLLRGGKLADRTPVARNGCKSYAYATGATSFCLAQGTRASGSYDRNSRDSR